MKKLYKFLRSISLIGLSLILLSRLEAVEELASPRIDHSSNSPSVAIFIPPKGWLTADQEALSAHIKYMVVGPKVQNEMPPTMNLLIEPYDGTLKDYLKSIKKINEAHGDSWKDLGILKTKAGEASLSQVDMRSKWGGEKLMHAIIVRNKYAYVLTATAAKQEFARFYQEFYQALRSLQIYDNILDVVKDPVKKTHLENAFAKIQQTFDAALAKAQATPSSLSQANWKEQIFYHPDFQNHHWSPFKAMLKRNYNELSPEEQNALIANYYTKLLN
ncbi:hypothetical protein [Neochlamydia sp. AcF95]|uniref:hypothetical protein n=1 Tax=Neochlamydia sp. AcF95 TaxID=2795734 RepID=UPI001BC91F52|nr:hypothetical protein [Neochlamydia sp. AcF95]MBS4171338.1 Uncharacterized protein [Neochlamydia sp. AcF95]